MRNSAIVVETAINTTLYEENQGIQHPILIHSKPSALGGFLRYKEICMNKRKSVLEAARNSNNKVDKNTLEYLQLQIVLEALSRYYEIYDMDNGTIHSQVFSMLYLSPSYYTYRQICESLYISKNTLVRYISKYNELALKISKRLKP